MFDIISHAYGSAAAVLSPPPQSRVLNQIEGSVGRDVLRSPVVDGAIIANGVNRSRVTSRGGDDTFVFGREAGGGVREVAVVNDHNVFLDTILLSDNAPFARTIEGAPDISFVLRGGDGNQIILKDQPDSGPLYRIQFDPERFGGPRQTAATDLPRACPLPAGQFHLGHRACGLPRPQTPVRFALYFAG